MSKGKHTEAQIIAALKQMEAGRTTEADERAPHQESARTQERCSGNHEETEGLFSLLEERYERGSADYQRLNAALS